MRLVRTLLGAVTLTAVAGAAQPPQPPPAQPPTTTSSVAPETPRGAQPPEGRGGRGGGRGRGAVQIMTLTTTAWPDGGQIPTKHTQAGDQVSPALSWSNVPENVQSFVLIMHDIDAATAPGTDDVLHWMLWNIPGASTSLPEGIQQAPQLPDGTRQISQSGPYYRGPGAAAAGPAHHYLIELFALDTMLDVPAVGQNQTPAQTRAAVVAAMATHVRGKAAYVGLFKRQ
jgi:Raf kinase inhibitor-like YbhB/YbcL family protein